MPPSMQKLATNSPPPINENDIFTDVRDQFLSSLSISEQAQFAKCTSAAQLIKDIENFEAVKKHPRLKKCIKKIEKFGNSLQPYFKVVDTFVSSHPEWAAIAWGAIRLLFQLASNYATFFEKLANTCEAISQELPQYEELAAHFKSAQSKVPLRLRASLCYIYQDLFNFFQAVVRVFTKKDGRDKGAPVIMASLLWKPYDVRFQDLLNQLKAHRALFHHELQLAHYLATKTAAEAEKDERVKTLEYRLAQTEAQNVAKRTLKMSEAIQKQQEKEYIENLLHRSKLWLSPPEFSKEFEHAISLRESDTGEWLFEANSYQKWISAPMQAHVGGVILFEHALWIQGSPGSGKTVLAASVVEELQSSPGHTVCYFFFRYDDEESNVSTKAYRAILAQLLQSCGENPNILDKHAYAMDGMSSGQLVASRKELLDLLLLCTPAIKNCVIVLDGVDECEDREDLIRDLLPIAKNSDAKLLLFSRPNVSGLSRSLPKSQWLKIGKLNSGDISLFFSRKLDAFCQDGLLPSGSNNLNLLSRLITGADGMFLWARLMTSYLDSPALTPSLRLKTILEVTFPEGLHVMYARITGLIARGRQIEQRFAEWIISWLAFSKRQVTEHELRETTKVIYQDNIISEEQFPDFQRTVIITCAGLVEPSNVNDPRLNTTVPGFRFIHLTVLEFLFPRENPLHLGKVKEGTVTNSLPITSTSAHLDIARGCLQYLIHFVPAQPLGGTLGQNSSDEYLNQQFPLCNYAALHWSHHLEAIASESTQGAATLHPATQHKFRILLTLLARFLLHKLVLTAWLEACYVFKTKPNWGALGTLSRWLESSTQLVLDPTPEVQRIVEDLSELEKYLEQLDKYWGTKLLASPSILWEEATAFTPSRLLVKTNAINVTSLVNKGPTGSEVSSQCLRKISEVSPDGLFVGVLSVWPSRSYEDYAIRRNDSCLASQLRQSCSGWVSQYEVWSIGGEPRRVANMLMVLSSEEIWLQIQQSFWLAPSWNMQFPLSISPCLRRFTVLRHLFALETKVTPRILPLTLDHIMTSNWTVQSREKLTRINRNSSSWKGLSSAITYLYHLKFSPDGRFLFFADTRLGEPLSLLVFKFDVETGLDFTLVQGTRTTFDPDSDHFRAVEMILHPTKTLLAVSMIRLVLTWDFDSGAVWEVQYGYLRGLDSAPAVRFSDCGSYIIIQDSASINPSVIPVLEAADQDPSHPHHFPMRTQSSSRFPKLKAQLFRRDNIITLLKNHGKDMAVIATGDTVSMSLQGSSPDGTRVAEIELTKLPNWAGIKNIRAVVQLPKSREDKIKIVLNKTLTPWCVISPHRDVEHLPAVIERDPRSLERLRKVTGGIPALQIDGHRASIPAFKSESNLSEFSPYSV